MTVDDFRHGLSSACTDAKYNYQNARCFDAIVLFNNTQ